MNPGRAQRATALRAHLLYRFFRAGDEEVLALRGVSLDIWAGEMVAVIGPSGSGKSTLLTCLAGLDEPSGGTVWVAGHRMSHTPEPARARLRAEHIGLLGQGHNLFDHLTVDQNMQLVRRMSRGRGHPAGDLLESVGVAGRATATPRELSGGEVARAGLAVALAGDPDVLIADEPTGELDESTELRVLELMRARAEAGTAVLVASHSVAVRRAVDRVLTLDDGALS